VSFFLSPSKPGQSHDLKAVQEFRKIEHANAITKKSTFFEILVFMYELKKWLFIRVFCKFTFILYKNCFMGLIASLGKFILFILDVFRKSERRSVMYRLVLKEIYELGFKSLAFVVFVSLFVGAVVTLQTAANMTSSFMPKILIGYATRDAILLEFSPTIISLLLAGKIGSNIASSIGTMKVTEQIDALEVMGVNPATHLVRPKIFALVFFNPLLIVLSMFAGIIGGLLAGTLSGECTVAEFVSGIQYDFIPFKAVYAIIKTVLFAFVIASVSSFHGFYTDGGALEVGKSSTKAVVYSSVVIIVLNYILTQLLLN
jgi:phospholipid/cholesterol/gamma-HCH transport system permease protein